MCLSDPGSTERTAQKRKFPSPPHFSNGHSPQDTSTSPIKKKKKPGLLNNNNKEQVRGHREWCPHSWAGGGGGADKGGCFSNCPCAWHLGSCLALAVICIGQKGELRMGLGRNSQWLFRSLCGNRTVTQIRQTYRALGFGDFPWISFFHMLALFALVA